MRFVLLTACLTLILASAGCREEAVAEPQHLLVVLNKSSHSATVIDLKTGLTKATLATGVGPHEVASHPGRGLAVVSNYGTLDSRGFSLTVLDLLRLRVKRTIPLGRFRGPHGIQFFRNGERVAVTAEDSEMLLILNLTTGKVEKAIPTRQKLSHMVVLSPDEERAYVSNISQGTLSVLDIREGVLIKILPVGKGAEGLDVAPDGGELWIANREEDSLAIVDTRALEVTERIPCAEFPVRVRFTPDGSRVLVSNARSGDLAVFNRRSREEAMRIPMEISAIERRERLLDFDLSPVPVGIVTDPSGERVYVANSNADIITVIDLTEGRLVDRLVAGVQPDGMAYVVLKPDFQSVR